MFTFTLHAGGLTWWTKSSTDCFVLRVHNFHHMPHHNCDLLLAAKVSHKNKLCMCMHGAACAPAFCYEWLNCHLYNHAMHDCVSNIIGKNFSNLQAILFTWIFHWLFWLALVFVLGIELGKHTTVSFILYPHGVDIICNSIDPSLGWLSVCGHAASLPVLVFLLLDVVWGHHAIPAPSCGLQHNVQEMVVLPSHRILWADEIIISSWS